MIECHGANLPICDNPFSIFKVYLGLVHKCKIFLTIVAFTSTVLFLTGWFDTRNRKSAKDGSASAPVPTNEPEPS